jgi:hypothetical protein
VLLVLIVPLVLMKPDGVVSESPVPRMTALDRAASAGAASAGVDVLTVPGSCCWCYRWCCWRPKLLVLPMVLLVLIALLVLLMVLDRTDVADEVVSSHPFL